MNKRFTPPRFDKAHWDATGFWQALSRCVVARRVTWKQVGEATGVSASTLSRMGDGRHPDAASLSALSAWAGLNPADYVRAEKPAAGPWETAYDKIDRHLRNTLDDDDYAEFSAALEILYGERAAAPAAHTAYNETLRASIDAQGAKS